MSLTRTRAIELAQAAPRSDHAPDCDYLDGAPYCSRRCPVRSESAEYQCAALHGKSGAVVQNTPPHGPCPGHGETYTAPALAPERREVAAIAAPGGYSPRLRKLARLPRTELLARYLQMNSSGRGGEPGLRAKHAVRMTRDQLMAALLERPS